MRKYIAIIVGAILGTVLIVQMSSDLAFIGLIGGALVGWLVAGRPARGDVDMSGGMSDGGWGDSDSGDCGGGDGGD